MLTANRNSMCMCMMPCWYEMEIECFSCHVDDLNMRMCI